MGYTNQASYWTPSPETTQAVIEDIQQLVSQSRAAIDFTQLDGQFKINGKRPHDYDEFTWPESPVPPGDYTPQACPTWHVVYCKTDRNKYDMVVFAALLAIKHHVPDAEISTDDSIDLESATYDIRHRQYSRGCRSIVELLQKMHMNEFSPQHQLGLKLYERTFPDRDLQQTIPWEPVI